MKALLGKKIGMGRIFNEEKHAVPVTFLEVEPCAVLQVKTKEKDGYEAVQIGSGKLAEKRMKKSQKGKGYRFIKEFPQGVDARNVGDLLDVSLFAEGDVVHISGISKGKGFQGAVKRHGFHGRNASHGTKHEERTVGSIGSTGPQRVIKGKKMPGRMGSSRVTVKNVQVVKVDQDARVLAVKGQVPGKNGGLVEIRA